MMPRYHRSLKIFIRNFTFAACSNYLQLVGLLISERECNNNQTYEEERLDVQRGHDGGTSRGHNSGKGKKGTHERIVERKIVHKMKHSRVQTLSGV